MKNIDYPVNITLTKLETLKDAEHPQEEKYPSGSTVRTGLMWEFSLPKIGESFEVKESKMWSSFHTSRIIDIEHIDDKTMILTTKNSKYKLELE